MRSNGWTASAFSTDRTNDQGEVRIKCSALSTLVDLCIDKRIEAHQYPLMMHSEGQKINVCDLAMGQHLITADGGRHRPERRNGPELIVGTRQQSDQPKVITAAGEPDCWGCGAPEIAQNTILG